MSTESSVQLADPMSDEIVASWSRSAAFGLLNEHVTPPYEPAVDGADRLVALASSSPRPCVRRPLGNTGRTRCSQTRMRESSIGASARDTLRSASRRCATRAAMSGASASSARTPSEAALAWAAPLIVRGREHFADALAHLTGAAATITDPRSGQLLGVVGLLCAVEDTNALLLPYACRVAPRDREPIPG